MSDFLKTEKFKDNGKWIGVYIDSKFRCVLENTSINCDIMDRRI